MSLVIASKRAIVADCYYAKDGEPRLGLSKLVRGSSNGFFWGIGYVGYGSIGQFLATKLDSCLRMLEEERVKDVDLLGIWHKLVMEYRDTLPQDALEATTFLVLLHKDHDSYVYRLEGTGLGHDLTTQRFSVIGYSPAICYATAYLDTKDDCESLRVLTDAIIQTARRIDYVDATDVYSLSVVNVEL